MRLHWHLGQILAYQMKGQHRIAMAYNCQLLRAIYQVNLDGGSWTTAACLLPKVDPAERSMFVGTPQELEAAAAYLEAVKKVSTKAVNPFWRPSVHNEAPHTPKDGDTPKKDDKADKRETGKGENDEGDQNGGPVDL